MELVPSDLFDCVFDLLAAILAFLEAEVGNRRLSDIALAVAIVGEDIDVVGFGIIFL